MRETSVRGPAIDLGEFERRLRGAQQRPAQGDDLLGELARLVHGEDPAATDPYGRILAEPHDPRGQASDLRGSYDAAPEVAAEPPYYPEHAIEQPLERAYSVGPDDHEPPQRHEQQQGAHETVYYGAEANWSEDSQYLDYGHDDGEYEPQYDGGWRSWLRPWHAVVAISLVAVLSIGFAFWHRSGSNASREIATIMAPDGPVKVKPSAETEATADASGAVVLDRKEQAPVQQVVTNQEQAVDPSVTPKAAQLGNGPVDLPHEPPPVAAAPKRVKTVTVRPDGSRVDEGALPPAVAVASRPAPEASPAANAAGAATTTATPPSQAKPTATPPRTVKPKPVAPSAAVSEPAQAAALEADSDQPGASSTGGFAVQFGATGSEADARAMLKTVAEKYRGPLGGLKPTFKMATVNDKTVYRVRVGGVSKESANAICGKVKASGGACFVAGN
ncbi:MAG: SPOR domain-containing protein [Alphaproteobacteria bacterium]|nr:SPOR domain-containing protein [Alphaproteobacteria bacterium]MBM3653729.1 SPOR domain-containing protein [Alphaproteobacteria bacterium]